MCLVRSAAAAMKISGDAMISVPAEWCSPIQASSQPRASRCSISSRSRWSAKVGFSPAGWNGAMKIPKRSRWSLASADMVPPASDRAAGDRGLVEGSRYADRRGGGAPDEDAGEARGSVEDRARRGRRRVRVHRAAGEAPLLGVGHRHLGTVGVPVGRRDVHPVDGVELLVGCTAALARHAPTISAPSLRRCAAPGAPECSRSVPSVTRRWVVLLTLVAVSCGGDTPSDGADPEQRDASDRRDDGSSGVGGVDAPAD